MDEIHSHHFETIVKPGFDCINRRLGGAGCGPPTVGFYVSFSEKGSRRSGENKKNLLISDSASLERLNERCNHTNPEPQVLRSVCSVRA